jgi:hypothetical protein
VQGRLVADVFIVVNLARAWLAASTNQRRRKHADDDKLRPNLTIRGVRELAGMHAEEREIERALWIKSVQHAIFLRHVDRPQRLLPVWQRQEVQEVPRRS